MSFIWNQKKLGFWPATIKTIQPPDCPQICARGQVPSPTSGQTHLANATRPVEWDMADMAASRDDVDGGARTGSQDRPWRQFGSRVQTGPTVVGRQEKPGPWRPSSSAWTGESIRAQRPRTKTKEPRMNHRSKPNPAPRPNPSGAPSSAHDRARCPCTKVETRVVCSPHHPVTPGQSKCPIGQMCRSFLAPTDAKTQNLVIRRPWPFGSRSPNRELVQPRHNIRWKNIYPGVPDTSGVP